MSVRAKPLVLQTLQVASPRTLTPPTLPEGEGECTLTIVAITPRNTPQTQTPALRRVFAWMQIG